MKSNRNKCDENVVVESSMDRLLLDVPRTPATSSTLTLSRNLPITSQSLQCAFTYKTALAPIVESEDTYELFVDSPILEEPPATRIRPNLSLPRGRP